MKLGIFLDSELVTSELWHFQSEAVEKMTRVDRTSHFISSLSDVTENMVLGSTWFDDKTQQQ